MNNQKPEGVKITNIVLKDQLVLGLGDDSLVYYWDAEKHIWNIYTHY
ncbi:MAG: hypothetical protein V4478_00305 [Patescibacteria group bacterium]